MNDVPALTGGLGQQLNSGKNAFHPANTGGERSRL